ncbi:MAG: DUF1523 family protein [Kiloniellales bacterium]
MSRVVWFVVRWGLKLLPLLLVAAFLHFYLPGHDIVRIVGTEVNRIDRPARGTAPQDGLTLGTVTRDVRFINSARPNGRPAVYRNEDTGWSFPWYFKFNSGTLQAEAQNLISTQENPKWVAITHYGWRLEILSMFPNAVDVDLVEGPDATVVPWFNIAFLTVLAVALFLLWRAWRRFLRRLALDERFENASNSVGQIWRWIKANGRDAKRKLLGGT